jgi:benzodiazapine receptor|tara:strand:+ start:151 stop:594 length:444 start_codon:yes stop_codon:yes gene_type:complete
LFFSSKFSVFIYVILALIIGGLASSNTADDVWYQALNKSPLNPPGYVFGIVWPILYLLMSISAFRTFNETKNLFLIQLLFNALWSWLFFAFQMPFVALLNIWLLIYLNIKINLKMFYQDKLSGLLFIPYILWLFFASYLNLFIVLNN